MAPGACDTFRRITTAAAHAATARPSCIGVSQQSPCATPRAKAYPLCLTDVAEHLFLDVGVGDELPAVAILVAEVEATAVVEVVDLHVVLRAGRCRT